MPGSVLLFFKAFLERQTRRKMQRARSSASRLHIRIHSQQVLTSYIRGSTQTSEYLCSSSKRCFGGFGRVEGRTITDRIARQGKAFVREDQIFQKAQPQAEKIAPRTAYADYDEEEVKEYVNGLLGAIDELYPGFQSQAEGDRDDNNEEDEDDLIDDASEMKGDKDLEEEIQKANNEKIIPGLEGMIKDQPLIVADEKGRHLDVLQALCDDLDKQRMAMAESAAEVESWPEWDAYNEEFDREDQRIREEWENSPDPVTPETAQKLHKDIAEAHIRIRAKWTAIARERFRREMAVGLHPRLAKEWDEATKRRQDVKPRPTRELVEMAPRNPAFAAAQAVRQLLPEKD